jgi:PAS domain S-box-containing protein
MDQRSFQRLLRRTVAIPVILLVLLAVTLLVEIMTLTSSLKWVDHAEQVISNSRQLMRYMVDMETGLRGYHLTGDESFLEPYEAARPHVPEQLTLLLKLTANDPSQQARLQEVGRLDLRWMQYAEALLQQPAGKSLSAQEFQTGKDLMDQIRSQQRQILDAEGQLRNVRYRRATILGNIADGTAVGLSLLVAFLLFTLTRRELYALSSTYERHLKAEAERTQQLIESRESFQITLKSIGDAVVSTDAVGRVSFLNPVAQQLTGWDYGAAYGRPFREVLRIIDERTRAEVDNPVETVQGVQAVVGLSNNLLLLNRSGREFPIELTGAPIRDDQNHLVGFVIVFRDVTQRRQTEQTLRSNERLTLAGRLSATIAHEIRNPLDTVSNLIYLLRHEQQQQSATSAQYLEMAGDELARIAQITGQLLTFHREALTPVNVSLVDVLQSVLVLFAPQIRKSHVVIEQRFETTLAVRGFPGELRQVFSNLVGNAIDAMSEGGKLVLRIRASSHASDSGRLGLRVTVLDSGSGIPVGARRNLFAPFYTTKGEKGTGLGLWVSRGIIEKHEGTIHFRSSLRPRASGTAFSVFLPFEQLTGMLDVPNVPPTA